jgi:predicted metal-dependent phosphoesterase TrpH
LTGKEDKFYTTENFLRKEDWPAMIFDIHIHTRRYSGCSNIEPEELIYRAKRIGLDGIALTEHGIRWPDEMVKSLFTKTGINDLMVVIGQEVTCFHKGRREGDFLVFGVNESLGSNISAKQLIERVHGEAGIVIPAHPYKRSRIGDSYYGIGDGLYNLEIDAIELYHPEHDEDAIMKVKEASMKMGLPMTGGSDAHDIFMVGACTTLFLKEIKDERDFIDAIRTGSIIPRKGHIGKGGVPGD